MGWPRYIARRLALIALSLLILSVIVFAVMEIIPGDLARTILGRGATPQEIHTLEVQLGLDRPFYTRYLDWLGNALHGNLGQSITFDAPIAPLLVHRALNSLLLAALAGIAGLAVSILLGFVAGLTRHGWLDRLLSRGGVGVGSLPEFLIALILILIFSQKLHWFPGSSYSPSGSPLDNPAGLILPALTMMLVMMAYNLRITRASVVKVLDEDYVVSAELKHLPRGTIVRRHIAPNALLPTITVAGAYLGWMVGGLIVVETIFDYPGIGSLIYSAAQSKDVPLLLGAVIVVAAFRMFVNLMADVAYKLVDPRVKLG